MLKKLFVHEWKDTWKLMAILNAAVILLTLCGLIVFNKNGIGRAIERSDSSGSGFLVAGVMSYFFLYAVTIAALSIASTLYFFVRFYRNLYTDQGYLMHTLPVTEHELIWSKTFVAVIWRLISTIVSIWAVITLLASAMGSEFWNEMWESVDDFGLGSGRAVVLIILIIIGALASAVFSLFMGYTAVSFGQQFPKNKVLASIGIYLGMNFALNMVTNIITQVGIISAAYTNDAFRNWEPNENTVLLFMLILDLVAIAASVGLYFVIHHCMKKKLNLD